MEKSLRIRNAGLITFFLSGICVISTGIIVPHLQDLYGFNYETAGLLIALMHIGNLLAGFAAGILPGLIGLKKSVVILSFGYILGYVFMGFNGLTAVLMLCFFTVGLAKGCVINTCTVLVGDNSENRTMGMNLMHAGYALGALLCPFVVFLALFAGDTMPMFALAGCGLILWLVYIFTPIEKKSDKSSGSKTDWSFLKSRKFWLLTILLFFQNAAETGVTSWLVSYFKNSGIIAGMMSAYTVTVLWGATLAGRLLLAFVIKPKKPAKIMIIMSAGCILFYIGLMLVHTQLPAILLLFLFAFSMAGMNPTAVAMAGSMSTVTSIGVLLPVASAGSILMPWIIGVVAENAGMEAGMMTNIVPCVGLLIFTLIVGKRERG